MPEQSCSWSGSQSLPLLGVRLGKKSQNNASFNSEYQESTHGYNKNFVRLQNLNIWWHFKLTKHNEKQPG